MKIDMEFGSQAIRCSVQPSRLKANTYEGVLEDPISDACAVEFWRDYEQAVNDVLLSEVDALETRLLALPFFVLIDGQRFHASAVDLQVHASTGCFSLTLPRT